FQPAQFLRLAGHFRGDLEDPVYVALSIDAPRQGQSHEVEARRLELSSLPAPSEHHAPDLAGSNSPLQVELAGERLPRKLLGRDVREEAARVDEHRVTAGWAHGGNAGATQTVGQIAHGGEAVLEITLVQHLLQTDRQGFQIP